MTQRRVVDMKAFSQELGVFHDQHVKALRDATARGVAESIPDLIKASPVDTGLYAQSWDMTVEEKAVILGNYAPYAPVIEHGARPFAPRKPPIKPLLEWAKRVLQDSSQPIAKDRAGMTGESSLDGYSDQVWALAVYTQKKISEEGMKPRHVMTNMVPQILENVRKEMLKLG